MTAYRYEAVRADGATVRGALTASSGSEAAGVLSARGLFPVRVEPAPAAGAGWYARRPSPLAQARVLHSLASLVEAGIPLEQALRISGHVASGWLHGALERVRMQVREGVSLGAAFAAQDGVFSGVVIGLVRAGERGVGLGPALAQAAAHLEREAETAARIRGALAYPLLLATVGTLSVGVIVLFVVPKFAAILSDLGQALPLATRLLITASAVARRFGLVIAGAGIAAAMLCARWVRRHSAAWHDWLLDLPLIGPVRHGLATARTCRSLAALLGTGTPALSALAIAQDAAGDGAVAGRLARARAEVAEGAALSAALTTAAAFTPNALQVLVIGERSGRLPVLLLKAADLEEREAERRLKTLVTLVEPALILAFAGMVAFVAAALLQAVYSLRPGAI